MGPLLALWALNLALLMAVLALGRNVVGARRYRLRSRRRAVLASAMDVLPRGTLTDELFAAWSLLLESGESDWTVVSPGMAQRVFALEKAHDDVVLEVRSEFADAVNAHNRLCELIDEGLVRPSDIARTYPRDHERLLTVLHLLEPFIWYESILRGRGRWGFRVAQLRRAIEVLRPASPRPSLRAEHRLEVRGLVLMALPEVRPVTRMWRLAMLSIRSPTINVRSKLRQGKYKASLTRELGELGIALHQPVDGREGAVEW